MVFKRNRGGSHHFALSPPRDLHVRSLPLRRHGWGCVDPIGKVRGDPVVNGRLVHTVAEHVIDRAVGTVDGQLREIRSSETGQLCVEIGKEAGLHERIIGDLDPWHEIAGVESDLLGFREIVGWISVEGHFADELYGRQLFGHQLRGIEQIDAFEALGPSFGQHLHAEFPFEEGAGLDPVGQVAPVEVWVDPAAIWASSQTREWTPARGFQWNFTSEVSPLASTRRNVWTPKPSIVR